MFSPDSSVRLLNMQIDPELRNTLWFPDRNTQTNWFLSQTDFMSFTDYSYVKKDDTIVLACREEDIWRFNYVMYQNSNFSNKWFYAFIVKREWASDYSTRIYLKTDPLQTWMFDWVLKTSFVSRQHSTTDVAGDNIVPEPIGGDTQIYQQAGWYDASPGTIRIFATSFYNGQAPEGGELLNGIYSGATMVDVEPATSDGAAAISATLNSYVENGTASAVARIQQSCFIYLADGAVAEYSQHPSTVDGYVPKNKKILSGAFIKGYLTAYGQMVDFTPEFCYGNDVQVRAKNDVTTGTTYFYIENYGSATTEDDTGTLGFCVTIPESTWAYNQYKNDYNLHNTSNSMMVQRSKQNQFVSSLNAGVGLAGNIAGLATGVVDMVKPVNALSPTGLTDSVSGLVGNVQGGINNVNTLMQNFGGYDEISQQLAAIGESYNAPPVGNVAASNPFLAAGITKMRWGWKVPDQRIARLYDDFLTVYGYAQNRYMVPNLHARQSWTYIKTAELMADCNCPSEDEIMIRAAFNRGIFFWAYTANYGDFSQSNGIV